jgi:integrase
MARKSGSEGIRERSRGSWEIRFEGPRDASGKRKTRTTTVRGTLRDAQRERRRLMATIDQDAYVDPSKLTVGTYFDERVEQWSRSGKIRGPATENYRYFSKRYITPYIGPIRLQKLSTLDIERWHVSLYELGLGTRLISAVHNKLKNALGEAVRHNLLVRNVCREQRPPSVKRKEIEILPEDQIDPMLVGLKGHWFYPMTTTSLYTGIRRGEMLALKWRDINLDARTMRIERALEQTRTGPNAGVTVKEPKTENSKRTLHLPTVVVDALRDWRLDLMHRQMALGLGKLPDDLVFPRLSGKYGGKYWRPTHFSNSWIRVRRRLKVPNVSWHALRHTHASMLIALGVDIVAISKRLGHVDPQVTLRTYSHLFRKDGDAAAAAAIDQALARG